MKHYTADTNFILRYLLADNKSQHLKAKNDFDSAKNGQITISIEQTVFTEVIFVLSSFYEVPRDKIADTLTSLLSYKGVIADKKIYSTALHIYQSHNMHIVDSILAAKKQIENIAILTFDKKLNNLTKF